MLEALELDLDSSLAGFLSDSSSQHQKLAFGGIRPFFEGCGCMTRQVLPKDVGSLYVDSAARDSGELDDLPTTSG